MENIEMNQQAVKLLAQWDPFGIGAHSYDTETADVVAALQGISNARELALVIQRIYEHSFEEWIEIERCEAVAEQLVDLKLRMSCEL